jgi:Phosphodiester glycosidase
VAKYYLFSLITAVFLAIAVMQSIEAETATLPATTSIINQSILPWRNLKPSDEFTNTVGLKFFRLKTQNGSLACLIVINLRDKRYVVKPFFNKSLGTTSDAARSHNALVAINGGYFNLSNGESTSYVLIDGEQQCDPKTNKALVENPLLKPYLKTIFNRSQVTFIKNINGGCAGARFSNHNASEKEHPLTHEVSSLQAGPRLLPNLTDKEEAFVRTDSNRKVVDAIGSRKLAARTAFGTTADGYAMLLCIASKGQDEFSSGSTLVQLADLLKTLGCTKAINFDGGTSTTMVIQSPFGSINSATNQSIPYNQYQQVCGRNPEKLVKSGLMILPAKE